MKRRAFIAGLGATGFGAAASTWPRAARAQRGGRVPRIALWVGVDPRDGPGQQRAAAFRDGMRTLGWIDGSNVQHRSPLVHGDGRAEPRGRDRGGGAEAGRRGDGGRADPRGAAS